MWGNDGPNLQLGRSERALAVLGTVRLRRLASDCLEFTHPLFQIMQSTIGVYCWSDIRGHGYAPGQLTFATLIPTLVPRSTRHRLWHNWNRPVERHRSEPCGVGSGRRPGAAAGEGSDVEDWVRLAELARNRLRVPDPSDTNCV
jgi:hypothetical protein